MNRIGIVLLSTHESARLTMPMSFVLTFCCFFFRLDNYSGYTHQAQSFVNKKLFCVLCRMTNNGNNHCYNAMPMHITSSMSLCNKLLSYRPQILYCSYSSLSRSQLSHFNYYSSLTTNLSYLLSSLPLVALFFHTIHYFFHQIARSIRNTNISEM